MTPQLKDNRLHYLDKESGDLFLAQYPDDPRANQPERFQAMTKIALPITSGEMAGSIEWVFADVLPGEIYQIKNHPIHFDGLKWGDLVEATMEPTSEGFGHLVFKRLYDSKRPGADYLSQA